MQSSILFQVQFTFCKLQLHTSRSKCPGYIHCIPIQVIGKMREREGKETGRREKIRECEREREREKRKRERDI